MERPYIILHMLISIDGKITGEYMNTKTAEILCEEYYRINREYKADAFLCGRITMEGSFTNYKKPNLSPYKGVKVKREDKVSKIHDYFAVSFDPKGKVGWYSSEIKDEDPGYDNAHIIEVLTEKVTDEYLAYLNDLGISYIFCGKEEIDVKVACQKLYSLFGIKKLAVEGGGVTDGAFLESGIIDELSLVVVPIVDGDKSGIDLFANKKRDRLQAKQKSV